MPAQDANGEVSTKWVPEADVRPVPPAIRSFLAFEGLLHGEKVDILLQGAWFHSIVANRDRNGLTYQVLIAGKGPLQTPPSRNLPGALSTIGIFAACMIGMDLLCWNDLMSRMQRCMPEALLDLPCNVLSLSTSVSSSY